MFQCYVHNWFSNEAQCPACQKTFTSDNIIINAEGTADEQPSTPIDDYWKKRCELEVLKEIKFMFELHSDMSSSCNGYRSLCEKIEKLEQLK